MSELAPIGAVKEREFYVDICALCHCAIDNGMCGYDCDEDGDSLRGPGKTIRRFYKSVETLVASEVL